MVPFFVVFQTGNNDSENMLPVLKERAASRLRAGAEKRGSGIGDTLVAEHTESQKRTFERWTNYRLSQGILEEPAFVEADSEESKQQLREWVTKVITAFEPNKVDKIDTMLSKFEGSEQDMFDKLRDRYGSVTFEWITDIFKDLKDGIILIKLLIGMDPLGEGMFGGDCDKKGNPVEKDISMRYHPAPKKSFHELGNLQLCLKAMTKHLKITLVNIRAQDIHDGQPRTILGVIWRLILSCQMNDKQDQVCANLMHTSFI